MAIVGAFKYLQCWESTSIFAVWYTAKSLHARKRIALIAHDHKKAELLEWAVLITKRCCTRHELYATGTTGKLLEEALDVSVGNC